MKLIAKLLLGVLLLLLLADLAVIAIFKLRQQTIANAIQEAVEEYVNGEVEMSEVKASLLAAFPSPAIEIDGLVVKDKLYPLHKEPFFKADKLVLTVRMVNLLSQNISIRTIRIEDGQFNVYTTSEGASNDYLFKGNFSAPGTRQLIDKLILKNISFKNVNEEKDKKFVADILSFVSVFKKKKQNLEVDTKCEIQTHEVLFHNRPSSFLTDKHLEAEFSMFYNPRKQVLHTDSALIRLNSNSLNLGITVDLSGESPIVNSKINAGKLILF